MRAADALQLAAALVAAEELPASLTFVTLDRQQGEAAEREGFTVLGPEVVRRKPHTCPIPSARRIRSLRSMSLAIGTRLGTYDVLALIGVGGMGEVYRAKDSKLEREVALKVLPDLVWPMIPSRLARFQREAQVLASLNHPHIAAIYGLEDADGVRAWSWSLSRAKRSPTGSAQGPIPLDEALPIARQIAEALEAAHEHGVVHRDLKPANIKLRPDGTVKVLDFGLAKAFGRRLVDRDAIASSPTIVAGNDDRRGVILGTAAYMAPEQAKGKAADARSDIWAFGVRPVRDADRQAAFPGETMVEILERGCSRPNPDWTALPPATPPGVRCPAPPLPAEGSRAAAARHRRCAVPDRRNAERARQCPCGAADPLERVMNGCCGWRP